MMIIIVSILIINTSEFDTSEFDTSEFKLIKLMWWKYLDADKEYLLSWLRTSVSIYVLIDEVILYNDEI